MFINASRFIIGILFIALLFICPSCRQKASGGGGDGKKNGSDAKKNSYAEESAEDRIKIKTPDEKPVVSFNPEGETIKFKYFSKDETFAIKGKIESSGKRKYKRESGEIIAEIKNEAGGFKVRTPADKLLWKVKVGEGKIKISNNEQNENPFILETKPDGHIVVFRDQVKIGEVKFYPDRGKVKIKDQSELELYECNSSLHSALYGILLMNSIPASERYILMAELMLRNQ
jgi:hypothetical protein